MSEKKIIEKPKICPLLSITSLWKGATDYGLLEDCMKDRCAWFKNGECAIAYLPYLIKWS